MFLSPKNIPKIEMAQRIKYFYSMFVNPLTLSEEEKNVNFALKRFFLHNNSSSGISIFFFFEFMSVFMFIDILNFELLKLFFSSRNTLKFYLY